MQQPVRIVITMEGGVIQAVTSLGVPCEVLVIDYDCETAHADDVHQVPQDLGGTEPALIYQASVGRASPDEVEFLDPHWEPAITAA